MTDAEKEELRLIVREELASVLQETRGGIAPDSQITGLQLIDKLIAAISISRGAGTQPPSKRR